MAETSLRRSSLLMTVGSLSSRALGMVRAALLTATIGLGLFGDAFAIANTLPNVLFQLAAGGVLNAVLVPKIVQATRRPDGGQEFTDRVLTVALAGMALVTVAATLAAPWLIRLIAGDWVSSHPDGFQLAVAFAYLCLPQIFFYGLYALLGNVLNARGKFVAFMWAPAIANVVAILGLLIFMLRTPGHGAGGDWTDAMIWWFGGTATVSVIAQALFLIVPLRRSGFTFRPRWGLRGVGLGDTSRLAGWAFAGLMVSQLPFFVSTRVLSWARSYETPGTFIPGASVTATAYQIFMLPHAFVTVSIVTALYPRMSAAAGDGNLRALKRDYRQGMAMPVAALVPAMCLVVLLARPVVSLLNPGVANPEALDAMASVLAIMVLGIVPFGLDLLNYRVFFALNDGRAPFLTQLVVAGTGIAITLTAYLAAPERAAYIYAGSIALSNLASWLTGVFLLRRRIGALGLARVVRTGVRVTVVATLAFAVTWPVARVTEPMTRVLLDALRPAGPWIARPLAYAVYILVVSGVFAVVYVLLARRFRIAEVADIAALVFGRLGRGRGRAAGAAATPNPPDSDEHTERAEEGQRGSESGGQPGQR